jgi:hypothetical protein
VTYSKKPAPAVAVMAHCKGRPVRKVMLKMRWGGCCSLEVPVFSRQS